MYLDLHNKLIFLFDVAEVHYKINIFKSVLSKVIKRLISEPVRHEHPDKQKI